MYRCVQVLAGDFAYEHIDCGNTSSFPIGLVPGGHLESIGFGRGQCSVIGHGVRRCDQGQRTLASALPSRIHMATLTPVHLRAELVGGPRRLMALPAITFFRHGVLHETIGRIHLTLLRRTSPQSSRP